MDSYEWNKIIGWALAAAIAVLGLSILTGIVYPSSAPEAKGYVVEGVELEADASAGGEERQPIAAFLGAGDPAKGEAQFKKCAACHTVTKGGATGIGPNLYGILGSKFAHIAGFAYSDAVKNHGGTWGWDEIDHWVESPRKYIPGNKMSFAGISRPQDRADLLVYLNAQSDSPLPLPAPPAVAEAPAEAAPAAETAEAATADETADAATVTPAEDAAAN